MSTLGRAIAIAAEAHEGQHDKAGQPYVLHVLRVMMRVHSDDERIVAVLHDLIEDTPWTLERLAAEGFAERQLRAISALTKQPGEDYEAFIERASQDPIARRVKVADLTDNADVSRIAQPTDRDFERIEKYRRALASLGVGS